VQRGAYGLLWALLALVCVAAQAAQPIAGIEATYADHTRAVELARAGKYSDSLNILLPLLARFPDDYPLQRDVMLVTLWQGDCAGALQRFERVYSLDDHPPYLVVPISDCMLASNRPKEAHRLTRLAFAQHPNDESLRNAFVKADLALRVDANIDEESPALDAALYNDTSDQGLGEWYARVEVSTLVLNATRLYASYLNVHSTEAEYQAGDMHRVGLGLRYRFNEQWHLDEELSMDLYQPGQGGSTTILVYEPRDAWRFSVAYASFSVNTPLRARAAGISSNQWSGDASYESRDYRLSWVASINYYDFTDTNQRHAFYTAVGYAYEMRAEREQRVFVEWAQSSNTLDDAVYFNPSQDYSLGITNRTDFIIDSRFRRHVDHLFLNVNLYQQAGYGTHPRYGIRYEQDYDFDARHSLVAGAGVARNIYDGVYETDWRFYMYYHQRF
jgi:hypothetical protein